MDENINQENVQYPVVDNTNSSFPLKKILSFVIGAIVILGVLALIIFVVLPQFRSKEPRDVTLTYWGIWEDSSAFEEIATEFTRQNPNIKIKYEKQDIKSLGKYIDRIATRMENGTGPDILRYHNSWLTQLKPLLLPLPENVLKETELEEKFFPVVGTDLRVKGAYYGVPIQFDSLALFINTKTFSDGGISTYPSTWDDLTSVARQLTVKDADGKIITSGVALGTYDNIAHSSDIVSLLLLQNGANLLDLNGDTRQSAVDGLDFYTSFAKGEVKTWDDTLENSKLAFAKGNLAMYFGYSWDIFEIKAINPDLPFAVVNVPRLPGRDSTVASYWAEGVSAKSKYSEEAFQFLSYLASRSTMEKMYAKESQVRLFGELYPRSDMVDLLKSNTLIYPFVAQGPNAKSTIFSSDTHDEGMVDQLNSYLGNAIRSMINDNTSAETAVETLSAGVLQVLSRYVGTQSN